jgi:hypothetical protein
VILRRHFPTIGPRLVGELCPDGLVIHQKSGILWILVVLTSRGDSDDQFMLESWIDLYVSGQTLV